MKAKFLGLPLAALLLSGCVSTSKVQDMIDENNQTVLNPRFEELEAGLGRSTRLTEQQRRVMGQKAPLKTAPERNDWPRSQTPLGKSSQ